MARGTRVVPVFGIPVSQGRRRPNKAHGAEYTGKCPACKKRVPLTAGDRVKPHSTSLLLWRPCPGRGKKPLRQGWL